MRKNFLITAYLLCLALIVSAQTEVLKIKSTNGKHFAFNIDFNNDGKMDILIRDYTPSGILYFYENTGSGFNLSFTLNIPAYSNFNMTKASNVMEQFYYDVDNDGNKDLLIYSANHASCTSNSVKIYW